MNFTEQFRQLIEERFASEMSIRYPDIPIQWDDQTFEQPAQGLWISITFNQNPAKRASIGKGKFVMRTTGFVQIDVQFHAESNLRVEAQNLTEEMCDIFAFNEFTHLDIKATFVEKHTMRAPAGGYGRFVGRITFRYDGLRAQQPAMTGP